MKDNLWKIPRGGSASGKISDVIRRSLFVERSFV